MKASIFYLFVVLSSAVNAQQLSAGVSFGFHLRDSRGGNVVSDSLTILSEGSRTMSNVYGLFAEYPVSRHFQFRHTVGLTNQLLGFLVNNHQATCQFCDIHKSVAIWAYNLRVENLVALKLPLSFPVRFHLIGGIRTNFNFTRHHPDMHFRNGTRHQGVAEVINNLDDTIKPVYFDSVIGLKANWRNFNLVFLLDKNLAASITDDIVVYGTKYRFINRTNTVTVTAGYNLIPLIRKVASSKDKD